MNGMVLWVSVLSIRALSDLDDAKYDVGEKPRCLGPLYTTETSNEKELIWLSHIQPQ